MLILRTSQLMRYLTLIATVLLCSFASANAKEDITINAQAIPQANLAYPVLIMRKNGDAGSGFFLNTANAMYLVTANHILTDSFIFDSSTQKYKSDAELELQSYSKDPSDTKRNLVLLNMSTLQHDGNVRVSTAEDVAVVTIGTSSSSPADGKAATWSTVPGIKFLEKTALGTVGVNVEAATTFDKIHIGNDVVMFGYPVSLGVKQIPQIDPHSPLLRKGIVAGKNAQHHSIVLDCPAYPGNSGGPIFEIDREAGITRFVLIGVVREYVPFAQSSPTFSIINNSGYSIATPMDAVLELINKP